MTFSAMQKKQLIEKAVNSKLLCGSYDFVYEDAEADFECTLEELEEFLSEIDIDVTLIVNNTRRLIMSAQANIE